jgi:hypothetical protein
MEPGTQAGQSGPPFTDIRLGIFMSQEIWFDKTMLMNGLAYV